MKKFNAIEKFYIESKSREGVSVVQMATDLNKTPETVQAYLDTLPKPEVKEETVPTTPEFETTLIRETAEKRTRGAVVVGTQTASERGDAASKAFKSTGPKYANAMTTCKKKK